MATTDDPGRDTNKQDHAQPSLLDDLDRPVPFALTVRARRLVAPESLPTLAVVQAPGAGDQADDHDGDQQDDPFDPRRARARALRRAGSRPDAIAAELQVDGEVIARWTDDVVPVPKAVHRRAVAEHKQERELPAAYVTGRAAARSAWRRTGVGSPGAGIGQAMVAGMAEVTPFAVRLRGELATVAGILQWLRDGQVVADTSLRVQVQAAPGASMDVVAHDVATRLSVHVDRVQARPWPAAPDAEAVEVLVRIGDPRIAGTIDAWRQCLLEDLTRRQDQDVDPMPVAG